jgi:CRISPR/Cas system-associated exonuclease Cas4 (RecB family)
MIVEKVIEAKERKIKQYPVNSNRASDLGIPCVRYHVLNRTRWQEKSLHDVGLQFVFDMGNEIEEIVMKELAEAHIKVIEQQRSFEWKEYGITGHIDGKILAEDGKVYPMEIKSCSPYVFKSINSINDLKNGKYGYLRKYPVQLNLYLWMDGKEKGVFLFKDKTSGQMKEIWMDIDTELGEETLKRAEAINQHIKAGTMPEPISEEMWCNGCPFAHICLPEQIGKEVEVDTGELSTMLDRLESLKPTVKEYDEIDKQVKETIKGREKILAGNWFITGKWIDKKAMSIAASQYWKSSIKRVSP